MHKFTQKYMIILIEWLGSEEDNISICYWNKLVYPCMALQSFFHSGKKLLQPHSVAFGTFVSKNIP